MDRTPNRIRLAILNSGKPQASIAAEAGMTPQSLSDLIHGRRRARKSLPALAEALTVPIAWLIEGRNAPQWAGAESDDLLEGRIAAYADRVRAGAGSPLGRLRAFVDLDPRSKTEIAKDAGLGRQVFRDILGGRIPGWQHLGALAKTLNVPLEAIYPSDPGVDNPPRGK